MAEAKARTHRSHGSLGTDSRPWIGALAIVAALGLLASAAGASEHVVGPGETLEDIGADDGVVLEPCSSGGGGRCALEILPDRNALELIASAEAEGDLVEVGTAAALFADFAVTETPTGESNDVLGVISLGVRRSGSLEATGDARARTRVEVRVKDRESGLLVGSQTLGPEAVETLPGSVEVDGEVLPVQVPAMRHVDGTTPVVLSVLLERGRSYRIEMHAAIEAAAMEGSALADFASDAGAGRDNPGVQWRALTVRIADDPFDTLEDLDEDFAHHTHEYLTGRGTGHNNTVATTSEPDAAVPPHDGNGSDPDDDDGDDSDDDGTSGWSAEVTVKALTSNRPGGTNRGNQVRFHAEVTGPSEVEYRWWVFQNGSWHMVRDWVRGGNGKEFEWVPSVSDSATLVGIWVQPVGRSDRVRYHSVSYPVY